MSHMHIPDGILPIWLIIVGWILTAILLAIAIKRCSNTDIKRKLPVLGIVSAFMIISMTFGILPIAYHLNLCVIAGILLGPSLAFIAVFIVVLIISMFGHGGVTVVSLNALVLGSEAAAGYLLFRLGLSIFGRESIGLSAVIATVFAILLGTSLMLTVVYLSGTNPYYINKNIDEVTETQPEAAEPKFNTIDIPRLLKVMFIPLSIGIIIEAMITAIIAKYIARVRPDLILSEAPLET